MSRSIYNIDLYTVVGDGSILGEDCDSTFSFDIVRVHDTFCYFLILTEYTALL